MTTTRITSKPNNPMLMKQTVMTDKKPPMRTEVIKAEKTMYEIMMGKPDTGRLK